MKKTQYITAIILLSLGIAQGPSTPLFQQDKGRDDKGKWGRDHLKRKDWESDRPTVYLDISVGLGSVDIDLRH